jgi:hypothetical protein
MTTARLLVGGTTLILVAALILVCFGVLLNTIVYIVGIAAGLLVAIEGAR